MNGSTPIALLPIAAAALVAIVFEPLPERIDLLGFVLSAGGLGALTGSFYGWRRDVSREQRAIYAEDFALLFAALAFVVFLAGAVIQEVT